MTEPQARPHLVVVQLDVGYTVSMGPTILACETLERVLASVHALLLPHAFDADPLIAPPPPPPPRPPEPTPPEDPDLPPYDPAIDTMPIDLRDEDHIWGDGVLPASSGTALEQANLATAIAAYREGTIDWDELRAGAPRYYPSYDETQLSAAVLEAQGLDPQRYGNGRADNVPHGT